MSLAHRTVLITRPLAQSARLVTLLEAEGARPELFPLIEIQPVPAALDSLPDVIQVADWLIFVSPSAIDTAAPCLARLPPGLRLATVGAASATKLGALTQYPVLYPQNASDSAALLAEPALRTVAGQRIVIVRGEGGRAEPGQTLSASGAPGRLRGGLPPPRCQPGLEPF